MSDIGDGTLKTQASACASRPLFAFWLGDNEMSEARRSAWESLSNAGLEVVFVTRANLAEHIAPDHLHPAFRYLNLAHQADYLRCYFMHFIGGGYTDIKWVDQSWLPAVAEIEEKSSLWAGGYAEVSPYTVSNIEHFPARLPISRFRRTKLELEKRWYRRRYHRLIAMSAFYFKPGTAITAAWWRELNSRMDALAPLLAESPARLPKEKPGDLIEGRPSTYPVPWTFLLGSILHPLSYRYRRHISLRLPQPVFEHPVYGHYHS